MKDKNNKSIADLFFFLAMFVYLDQVRPSGLLQAKKTVLKFKRP